jgi:hypothetical protein
LARGIQWDDQITPKLQRAASGGVDRFLKNVMQLHAPRVEGYARRNAKWHDRTGNARSGLRGIAESQTNGPYKIILAHGVPYGIYLEVRWSGRLGIINPTLAAEGPEVMRTVSAGLDEFFK